MPTSGVSTASGGRGASCGASGAGAVGSASGTGARRAGIAADSRVMFAWVTAVPRPMLVAAVYPRPPTTRTPWASREAQIGPAPPAAGGGVWVAFRRPAKRGLCGVTIPGLIVGDGRGVQSGPWGRAYAIALTLRDRPDFFRDALCAWITCAFAALSMRFMARANSF